MQNQDLNPTHYHAPELRPYEGREGAMDAFDLPSLVNGVSVPRKAPVPVCVGVVVGPVTGGHNRRLA